MLLRQMLTPASRGAGMQGEGWERAARHLFIVAADVASALITQTGCVLSCIHESAALSSSETTHNV